MLAYHTCHRLVTMGMRRDSSTVESAWYFRTGISRPDIRQIAPAGALTLTRDRLEVGRKIPLGVAQNLDDGAPVGERKSRVDRLDLLARKDLP